MSYRNKITLIWGSEGNNIIILFAGNRLSIYFRELQAVERPAPFATSDVVGQKNKRLSKRTMFPTLKNNATASYQGPVKIELLKREGLLTRILEVIIIYFMPFLFFFFFLGLNDVSYSLQDTGNKQALKLESVLQPHEETIISNLHFPDSAIAFVKCLTVYESGHN